VVPAQLAASAYAVADFLRVAVPADIGALAIARGIVLSIALAAPVGLLIALLWAAAVTGWPRLRRPTLAAVAAAPAGIAVWLAAMAGVIYLAADRLHVLALAAVAVAMIGLALVPLALWVALVARRALAPIARRAPAVGPPLAAALCAPAAAATMWNAALGLAFAAAAVGFVAAALVGDRLRRAGAAAAAVGIAVALSPLADDPAAASAWRRGVVVPAAAAALAPLLDRDGDGTLAVFGDGDCDEGEPAFSPDGIDVPENGLDEDCRFGDRRSLPPPPPAAAPRVARVVLITATDLAIDARGRLDPSMPALQAEIDRGIRFATSVAIAGRFRDVAPVLIDGALPPVFIGAHGGFATGADSIPAQLERRGGRAFFAGPRGISSHLTTQFAHGRTKTRARSAAKIAAAAAAGLRPRSSFVWAHFGGGPAGEPGAEIDRAAADLARRARDAGARLLVVGLPREGRRGGGPLAAAGPDLEPRLERAPVGLFDVHPTLAADLGLDIRAPGAGADLLALPSRPGTLEGAVGPGEVAIGARGSGGWVVHRAAARVFDSSAGRFAEDAAGPEAVAALAALVRDRFLAPRLAQRNQTLAAARGRALPADLEGTPAVIAGVLHLHGCEQQRLLLERRARITLYMSSAGGLRDDDLLAFKVSTAVGAMRSVIHPVGGALPFGRWRPGEVIAQTLDVDLRPVRGTATLWIAVRRDGAELPATDGAGNLPTWARVCNVEAPP
jgi:hypothetical protein